MLYHILKKSGSQNLSSGAMSLSTSFNRRWKLTSVEIHFSAACSQTVSISKDNALGSNYDTVLDEVTLSSKTDYVFRPTGEELFDVGDELKLAITQGGSAIAYAVIYGIEV